MARKLALNHHVTLQGDRTQSRRDHFGRSLAYVRLPGNGKRDLRRELIRARRARLFVFGRPFARLRSPASRAPRPRAFVGGTGAGPLLVHTRLRVYSEFARNARSTLDPFLSAQPCGPGA